MHDKLAADLPSLHPICLFKTVDAEDSHALLLVIYGIKCVSLLLSYPFYLPRNESAQIPESDVMIFTGWGDAAREGIERKGNQLRPCFRNPNSGKKTDTAHPRDNFRSMAATDPRRVQSPQVFL